MQNPYSYLERKTTEKGFDVNTPNCPQNIDHKTLKVKRLQNKPSADHHLECNRKYTTI